MWKKQNNNVLIQGLTSKSESEGNDMQRTRKIYFMLPIMMLITLYFSLTFWVDGKTAPTILESRTEIRTVARIYPLLPVINKTANAVRILKLSNLVATARLGNKDVHEFADDLGLSLKLIDDALSNKDSLPDKTAELELYLERLLIVNRMSALSIGIGKKLEPIDRKFLDVVISNKSQSDEETNYVIYREALLFNELNNLSQESSGVLSESLPADSIYWATHSLYKGLGACINNNESGSVDIFNAVIFYQTKKNALKYQLVRDIDAPLIAAALSKNGTNCNKAVIALTNLIRS